MSGRGGYRKRGVARGRPVTAASRLTHDHDLNSRGQFESKGRPTRTHSTSPRGGGLAIQRPSGGFRTGRSSRTTSRGAPIRGGLQTRPTAGKAILQRLGAPTDARDRLIHTRRRSVNDARSQIRKTQLSKTGDLRAVLKSADKTEDPELARELARVHSERLNTRENSDDVLLSLGSSLHQTDSVNAPRNHGGGNTLVISRNFPESNRPPTPDDYPPEHPLDITPPPALMSINTASWSRSPSPDRRSPGYWDDNRAHRPNITRTFERSPSRSRSPRYDSRVPRRPRSEERRRSPRHSPDRRFERDHYMRGSRPSPFEPILKNGRRHRELSPELRSTIHQAGSGSSHSRYDDRRYRKPSPRYSPPNPPRRCSYSRSPIRDREYRHVPERWNGPSPSHPPYRRSLSPRHQRQSPEYNRERRMSREYAPRRSSVSDNFKSKPETASRGRRYDERQLSSPSSSNGKSQSSDKYRRSNSKQGNQSSRGRTNMPAHPPGSSASANGSRLPNKIYYMVRISNLGDKVHQGDVEDLFGEMGKIKSVSMKSVGTAEVVYYDHNSVERSIEEYHRRELDKRPMEVVYMGEVTL